MRGVLKAALGAVILFGFGLTAGAAAAEQVAARPATGLADLVDRIVVTGSASGSDRILLAQAAQQSARLPRGTVRLRVIPEVGAQAVRAPITWRVMTFGRNSAGHRQLVTEVTAPTPSLTLPAGWYVVHAELPDQVIKHPVEVTAGRTFKYTLVKNDAQ